MIRFKMHAIYDHFPENNYIDGEPWLECYSDHRIEECTEYKKNNIAMLLEPRSLLPNAYEFALQHADRFEVIFTHDSELLKLPNTRMLLWADVWHTSDCEKNKKISLVSSPKDWCPLHKARLELAKQFQCSDKVQVFMGDWNNPNVPNYSAKDYLDEFRFSIVIENDLDDYWFTEKILNCFATMTIPIYVGAKRIGDIFNADGIIQVDDWKAIPEIVRALNTAYEYKSRLSAVYDNYERVKAYQMPWKQRFFSDYYELLNEVQNG